jgi:site-specific recombinase XerD
MKILSRLVFTGNIYFDIRAPPVMNDCNQQSISTIQKTRRFNMNEHYLLKFRQDMSLKNFTDSTCNDYFRFVARFLDFSGKEAMSLTYADIRKFIFHMKDAENKKASTINCYTAAIRFFFEYTLGYAWDSKKIPKMKRDRQLPSILTHDEVCLLIDSIDNYKHKAIVSTMYSAGLRVSEVCRLRYQDILRSKKMIYVSKSKNRQDRYAILSDRNLELLTEYWFRHNRPMPWLSSDTSGVTRTALQSVTAELYQLTVIMLHTG